MTFRKHLSSKARGKIIAIHQCGDLHQVVTVKSSKPPAHIYRRSPCDECPWRVDRPRGAFPAEAYRHSALTCYDMADSTFACHINGRDNPATCAGFLLSRGAAHNLVVRLALMNGRLDLSAVASAVPLYKTYQDMAIANGVDANDPALEPCRT